VRLLGLKFLFTRLARGSIALFRGWRLRWDAIPNINDQHCDVVGGPQQDCFVAEISGKILKFISLRYSFFKVSQEESRGELRREERRCREDKPRYKSPHLLIRHHIPQPIRRQDEILILRRERMSCDFWVAGHVRFQIQVSNCPRDSQDSLHTPPAPKYYSPPEFFDSNFFVFPEGIN
jgi:hypothetical protein